MMPGLFITTTARLAILTYRTFLPRRNQPRPSIKRLFVMAGFIPLFVLIEGIHWLGLLLDDILFPGYRRIEIRAPLFILGVPRSGTTDLHRVLAEDSQFTTFSTWECLFALSITARYFWLGIGRLDALIGRPGWRLLDRLESRAFHALEDVHRMRLSDPEEDYFSLMPVLGCFILILPFPTSDFVWCMGTFDRDIPEAERERLLGFYRGCLQRHLYVHGRQRCRSSKNAAFAPLSMTLAGHFPDARFLVCLRAPEQTLPSQLSSIASGIRFFDALSVAPNLNERLTGQLGFYYLNLQRAFQDLPENRCAWVRMQTLKSNLPATVSRLYRQLGLTLTAEFETRLNRQGTKAQQYRSSHAYSLDQFGLSPATIAQDLGPLYEALAARSIRVTDDPESTGMEVRPIHDSIRPSSNPEPALPC